MHSVAVSGVIIGNYLLREVSSGAGALLNFLTQP